MGSNCTPGDAAAVSGEENLALTGVDSDPSEILLFDMGQGRLDFESVTGACFRFQKKSHRPKGANFDRAPV